VLFTSKGQGFDVFVSNPKDNIIYAARKGGTVVAIKPVLEPGVVGEQARGNDDDVIEFEPAALGG
jgi:hypothetical protein